jgi:hypothetical protein
LFGENDETEVDIVLVRIVSLVSSLDFSKLLKNGSELSVGYSWWKVLDVDSPLVELLLVEL